MAYTWLILSCLCLQAYAFARNKAVTKATDLFPYDLPDELDKVSLLSYFTSAHKPTYASVYALHGGDINFVLAPSPYCQSVWLCFIQGTNLTEKLTNFNLNTACGESLRFVSQEQTVYYTKGSGSFETYVQATALVELKESGTGNNQYNFEAWDDLDLDEEDHSKKKTKKVTLQLSGKQIVVLTSSPYCHVGLFQQDDTLTRGYSLKFEPTDVSAFLKHDKNGVPTYFLTGTKIGSQLKAKMPKSSAFFDRTKTSFTQSTVNCCPSLMEFEGFLVGDDWEVDYTRVTFTRYKLNWVSKHQKKCAMKKVTESTDVFHQSIRIEIDGPCEWLAVCFDKASSRTVCENDGNLLGLVFVHDVYIPTDSDDAVQMAGSDDMNKLIRINFVINEPAIEMSYIPYTRKTFGVVHEMHLESYGAVNLDPTKLVVNLVKAPKCRARIAQDLNKEHLTDEPQVLSNIQCLVVSECTCLVNG